MYTRENTTWDTVSVTTHTVLEMYTAPIQA